MGFLDVILARPVSLDDAEEALGRPEKEEEDNLALHVSRCAKRWAMSYRASKHNSAQLGQIRLLLLIVGIAALFYSPLVQRWVERLHFF